MIPTRVERGTCPIPLEEVWQVLKEECNADDVVRQDFERHWPDCVEYRFAGNQGSGGKIYSANGHIYVGCYPEQDNDERLAARKRANARLDELLAIYAPNMDAI